MKYLNHFLWYAATPLLFIMIGASILGLFRFDTPFNAPFIWAWRHLALPIFAVSWIYAYTQRRYFLRERKVRRRTFWFCVVVIPALLLLMSGGIVLWVNASASTAETVWYRGPIKELSMSGGRRKTAHVTLRDESSGTDVTLEVRPEEFATLRVGQNYSREFWIGRLGIPFRGPLKSR